MKKFFAIALALVMALAMVACAKPADAPIYVEGEETKE